MNEHRHRPTPARTVLWGYVRRTLITISLFCQTAHAQTAKPIIDKIDPPNWFTQMPETLLLVHGEHLENTSFHLQQTSASIRETTIATNGHWAFLTLTLGKAHPGTMQLIAQNRHGSTSVPYRLSARRTTAQQPQGFNAADVMYLIMPDRFADGDLANDTLINFSAPNDRAAGRAYHGGDLRGIQQHLDYLQQMGVTTIWTTPLYDNSASQSGQTYHGYSASNMYAVDPHLGTMADYQALTAAAHARGIKIVLDTVPNHVGPASPWATDPPLPDWLHGSPAAHIEVDDDFASITDATATPARRNVLLNGWFANALPDLNQDNPVVAKYLLQNAVWWIESAGLDGLRIDTFPYVPRSFWHGYLDGLRALYPQLTHVGEVFNRDAHVTSFFAGGRANTGSDGTVDTLLTTPFDYPMYFALRESLTHHTPMTAIADVLAQDSLYPHPERLVTFIGNHDTKRFLSEPGADPAALKLAYGLLATMRGMPQLYYGDEILMAGGEDPDNRKDFPGGFTGDVANAFTSQQRTADQQAMYTWVSSLMQLRAHTPTLQTGQQQTLFADPDTLAFVRTMDVTADCKTKPTTERYFVVANNRLKAREIVFSTQEKSLAGCSRFSPVFGSSVPSSPVQGKLTLHLGPQEVAIFRVQP